MKSVKVFKSNKSQAVRLPKSVSFPETVKEVDIIVLGRCRLIAPAGEADDFMNERDQPRYQEREEL